MLIFTMTLRCRMRFCRVMHTQTTERSRNDNFHVKKSNRRSHFARAVHSHHLLRRWRRNDPFCCMRLFAANALQCTVTGEENKKPQTAPSPWDFVTLPDDRATAIGKDGVYGSGDILADRQTDRQTCSLQYFYTAPAGEV